jgi:hypothetical protein
MGLKHLLNWAAKEATGPLGKIVGFAEAAAGRDETDGFGDLVQDRDREMSGYIDTHDPSRLGDMPSLEARAVEATKTIEEIRDRTLDYVAATEAKAVRDGDEKMVRECRKSRREFEDNAQARLEEIQQKVRTRTSRDI